MAILKKWMMKMFIAKRGNQYWLWSSKKASLDCMPWYKSESIKHVFEKVKEIKFAK